MARAGTAWADAVLINLDNDDFTSGDEADEHYDGGYDAFDKDLSLKGIGARLGYSAVG
jgi:hypothetical protein